jgi:hypothetical protein
MSYEKCLACGSARVVGTAVHENSQYTLAAGGVAINRVYLCADCGFAAFFATQKFDPAAVKPKH